MEKIETGSYFSEQGVVEITKIFYLFAKACEQEKFWPFFFSTVKSLPVEKQKSFLNDPFINTLMETDHTPKIYEVAKVAIRIWLVKSPIAD